MWRGFVGTVALVAVLSLAGALSPVHAAAQGTPGDGQLEASPKGTIGLALVGAELGAVVPALFHYREYWAYIVGPSVGAIGGALMGWYLLDQPNHTSVAIASLAVGMVLIIPSVIITLSGTRYSPGRDYDGSDPDEGSRDDEFSRAEREAARQRRVARAGSGLFRLSEDGLLFGMPGFSVGPLLAEVGLAVRGGSVQREYRFELFSGSF